MPHRGLKFASAGAADPLIESVALGVPRVTAFAAPSKAVPVTFASTRVAEEPLAEARLQPVILFMKSTSFVPLVPVITKTPPPFSHVRKAVTAVSGKSLEATVKARSMSGTKKN